LEANVTIVTPMPRHLRPDKPIRALYVRLHKGH